MARRFPFLSRRIGKFTWDRRVLLVLVVLAGLVTGRTWLAEHPEHNPWASLDLRDPPGWATASKLRALRGDTAECRAVLARSRIAFSALPSAGEGQCARSDRTRLDRYPFSPQPPAMTCPTAIALELWRRDSVSPEARAIFGRGVASIEHLGAFSCRRMYGRDEGPWSEHATGNAIDIAGLVLDDGTRISILTDWNGGDPEKVLLLRRIRDGACRAFTTVLSPDYNAAHADHFHFDMAQRGWGGACR